MAFVIDRFEATPCARHAANGNTQLAVHSLKASRGSGCRIHRGGSRCNTSKLHHTKYAAIATPNAIFVSPAHRASRCTVEKQRHPAS
jgi:hypothetical protein